MGNHTENPTHPLELSYMEAFAAATGWRFYPTQPELRYDLRIRVKEIIDLISCKLGLDYDTNTSQSLVEGVLHGWEFEEFKSAVEDCKTPVKCSNKFYVP